MDTLKQQKERKRFNEKKIWTFEYRGIDCKIVNWNYGENKLDYHPTGTWNSYIYIRDKQLGEDFSKLLVKSKKNTFLSRNKFWDYSSLGDIFNMHHGITYYELIRDQFSGKKVGVKVGCDYIHLWDENQYYDVEIVTEELEKSVDSFIKHFPNYIVFNFKDGSYIKPKLLKGETL